MDLDPNVESSMLVRRIIENGISCFRKFYEAKKKAYSCSNDAWQIFLQKVPCPFFTRFVAHFFNKFFLAYLLFIILYISIYVHS
jgi:hypothetical protein